jgi:UPF0716 protein FxsA
MLPLFLLFVVLPIAEIMLLINVSGSIGGLNTFFIVIITAAFGAYFVRQQGFSLVQKIQTKLNEGKAPSSEMAQALLLFVAGVLLITPGFITDILGLLFTLPFSRGPIAAYIVSKVAIKQTGGVHFTQSGFNQEGFSQTGFEQERTHRPFEDGDIIDGEYTDKSENDDKNRLN